MPSGPNHQLGCLPLSSCGLLLHEDDHDPRPVEDTLLLSGVPFLAYLSFLPLIKACCRMVGVVLCPEDKSAGVYMSPGRHLGGTTGNFGNFRDRLRNQRGPLPFRCCQFVDHCYALLLCLYYLSREDQVSVSRWMRHFCPPRLELWRAYGFEL